MPETLESLCQTDKDIRDRAHTGKRHELRDRQFVRTLMQYFRPGPILELGASTGHLAALLQENGCEVAASEVLPKLVRAIASRGLEAVLVDATQDIVVQTGRRFSNVLAQAIGPIIHRDRSRSLITLRSIHGALDASGRFICIGPYPRRERDPTAFFLPREQIALAQESGLFRMIACFPHQVVPPSFYRPWNARVLNLLDHKLAYIASTRLVWVMEKADI